MVRTQIHLSDDDVALLDQVARETGASRSELIRRAVRERYGVSSSLAERKQRARRAFGAWKGRSFTGDEYVRAIRSGDMNENLRRLGA
ncbi:MAG TPA: ribbon-helix-helix domain-containing protein [Gaiellaceae bacterium]|jgi:predicted transcriptional regulator|nr:ribbon-helix-helix domain-containing protein [Gaiellaceae bacterium]